MFDAPQPTTAPDRTPPSPERQAELRAAYEANIAAGNPPYKDIEITDRNEMDWIFAERSWSGTFAMQGKMEHPDLRNISLFAVDLTGIELNGANLNGANLIGAILIGAFLINANLVNANLDGIDLSDARLDWICCSVSPYSTRHCPAKWRNGSSNKCVALGATIALRWPSGA